MRVIFSVTDLKVCPGAMTRYSPVAGSIRLIEFGIVVLQFSAAIVLR
jgi:hypothetical protein